jgi:hypothetical protein
MKARGWLWILAAALAVAGFVAPFACKWPDGLQKIAGALGFAPRAAGPPPLAAPLAAYRIPGMTHPDLSTAVAGMLGTALVFALLYAAARLMTARAARLVALRATRRHADTSP